MVSQPDRPRGRGRILVPSPVSAFALERELPLHRPPHIGTPEVAETLRAHAADLGVVVAYGQFLPRRIRELPTRGYLINGHASLLPLHRGAAPIARSIMAGDRETGVSVMRVEREMDAGPVALVRRLPIGSDETAGELEERMAALTAEAIAEALDAIALGEVEFTEQDHARATEAPKLGPLDRRLHWRDGAEALRNRVRALSPAPGAFTELHGAPLRILAATSEAGEVDEAPGTVRWQKGLPLRIATGSGWLLPRRLQAAGGKALEVDAFLRGRPIPDGTTLGH